MAKKATIGVMGPSDASDIEMKVAEALGRQIAEEGWVTVSGGMNAGVMNAVSRGAQEAGGLTVGILHDKGENPSPHLDIQIPTGMGSARNVINILSSDVVVAIGMSGGTANEVVLAVKNGRPLILLRSNSALDQITSRFCMELAGDGKQVFVAHSVEEAIKVARRYISSS